MELDLGFSVLSLIYFLLGSLITLLLSNKFTEFILNRQVRITWRNFFNTLSTFFNKIKEQKYRPDILIGLNNGIVAASIIATNLGIEDLYYYHIFPQKDGNDCRIDPEINMRKIDLKNKKVLIIDDQVYTGKSMEILCNHLKDMDGYDENNIVRCALYEYRSPFYKIFLSLPAEKKITHSIKRVPWSLSCEHVNLSTHKKIIEWK